MTILQSTISAATYALLTRLQDRGIGPAAIRKLIDQIEKSETLRELPSSSNSKSCIQADSICSRCTDLGINIISPLDCEYPHILRSIKDFPPLVYVKGDLDIFKRPSIAIVGTRKASDHGRKLGYRIASLASERGYLVTSGLALGIDSVAHRGALDFGGYTAAIMAHGLDIVTPSSNQDLADEILDAGGGLLSEHPPGIKPHPPEFVRRNRIQSGISMASIVVESGNEGGAIHQGKFTHEQGRRLFVAWPTAWTGHEGFNVDGAKLLIERYGAERLSDSEEFVRFLERGKEGSRFLGEEGRTPDLFDN